MHRLHHPADAHASYDDMHGDGVENAKIIIDGQRMKQVKSFKYLGSIISERERSFIDVKT